MLYLCLSSLIIYQELILKGKLLDEKEWTFKKLRILIVKMSSTLYILYPQGTKMPIL